MKNYIFACLIFCISIFSCSKKEEVTLTPSKLSTISIQENNSDSFVVSLAQSTAITNSLLTESNNFNTKGFVRLKTNPSRTTSSTISKTICINDDNGKPAFYINSYTSGGFVVISGDKRLPLVLGYSENGIFDSAKIPSGFNFYLSMIKNNVTQLRKGTVKAIDANDLNVNNSLSSINQISLSSSGATTSSSSSITYPYTIGYWTVTDSVNPLVNTHWRQDYEFNASCPVVNNVHTLVGCVPVAIGQVMYYWKYPTNFNWSTMDAYIGTSSSADLLYQIGQYAGTSYGVDGSSTENSKIAPTFSHYGYNCASMDLNDSYKNDSVQSQLVYNIMNMKWPFILSGGKKGTKFLVFNTYEDGHCWVADGIKRQYYICTGYVRSANDTLKVNNLRFPIKNYYHMNWGWGGYCDGYYALNYLDPGSSTFDYSVSAYYNIFKK